jgi:hypothetical protein
MTLQRLRIDKIFLSNLNRNYVRNGNNSVALVQGQTIIDCKLLK